MLYLLALSDDWIASVDCYFVSASFFKFFRGPNSDYVNEFSQLFFVINDWDLGWEEDGFLEIWFALLGPKL
jgi:hypothetical protein